MHLFVRQEPVLTRRPTVNREREMTIFRRMLQGPIHEIPDSPIVANFCGQGRPNANGLSIYFPSRGCSPFYDKQAFASSGWNQVIRLANRLED